MSRSNVGTLSVIVGANIRALNRGLNRGAKSVSRFASTVVRSAKQMAKFGAAAAVAGAFVGGILVRQQLKAIDATAKLGDQIGVATEELTRLHHAADLSGVGVNTLNSSMARMVRRVGKVRQGGGEAAKALEALGLNADQLTEAGPSEALRMIAERMNGLETQTDKVAVASRIFGNEGEAMINMLANGREGLEAAAAEADKLGLTFNRVEASRIEAANDAIARLKAMATGAARSLTIAVAPAIAKTAQILQRVSMIARDQLGTLWGVVQPVFAGIADVVTSSFSRMQANAFHIWRGIGGIVSTVASSVWSVVGRFFPATADEATGALQKVLGAFTTLQRGAATALGVIEYSLNNFGQVSALVFNEVALGVVKFAGQVRHFFTSTIPATLTWFAGNWRDILHDLGSFTAELFGDIGGNIVRIFANLPGLIAGTTEWGEVWTPLASEFEATVSELPKFADRQVGQLEQRLGDSVSALRSKVGGGLDAFLASREREAQAAADSFRGMFEGLGLEGAGIDRGVALNLGEDIGEGFSNAAQVREADPLDLIRAGSAEALAANHRAARAGEKVDQRQLATQRQMASHLGRLVRQGKQRVQPPVVASIGG